MAGKLLCVYMRHCHSHPPHPAAHTAQQETPNPPQETMAMDTVAVELESGTVASQQGRRWWRWLGAAVGVTFLCVAVTLFCLHAQKVEDPEQRNDLHHTLRQISGGRKAAIHLEGEYNSVLSNSSVVWRDSVGQAFSEGGLRLKNNEIVVPHTGLYFVYSQASFLVKCQQRAALESDGVLHLSHTILRWSESYGSIQMPLLSTMRSACKSAPQDNHWYSTIYLGAIFRLEHGDRLSTHTEEKVLPDVEGEEGKTFFGVFAL